MTSWFAVLLLILPLAACKRKADNSATRYAATLSESTVRAQEASEKANAAIEESNQRLKEAEQLGQ